MAALVLDQNIVSAAPPSFPSQPLSMDPSCPPQGNSPACAGQVIAGNSRTRLRAILPRPGAGGCSKKRSTPDDGLAGQERPRKHLVTPSPQLPVPRAGQGSAALAPRTPSPISSFTSSLALAAQPTPGALLSSPPAHNSSPLSFSTTPPPPLLAPRASYDPLAFARGMQALHGTALGRLMHTAPDIVVDGIPRRLLTPSPGSTAAKLGLLAPCVAQVLQQSVQPTTVAAAQAGNYATWSSICPSPPSQLPVASPTTSSSPVAWAPPSSLVAASQAPPGNKGAAAAVAQTPTAVAPASTLHAPSSAQVFPPAHGSAEWPGSTPTTCQPTTRVSLSACSDDGTTGSLQVSHMLPPLLPLSSGCLSQPAKEPWPLERNQSVTSKPAIQLTARGTSGAAAAPAGAQCFPSSASPSSFPEQVAAVRPSHEMTARVNCGNGAPQSPLHTFLTLAPPSKGSPSTLPTNPSFAGAAPSHVASVVEAQSLADDDSLAVESLLLIRAL
ncbi:unnamed protein product [Closterium sp. NIES-64]|nr:unnamed protein product [Closterium sp. NIES-64]CAI5965238.1 unnamed protein product [Closterium sp. NIES-65]